ncbi:MAG TPA: 50S ribosomal protein L35 [bacterium]|jgi:large subunit ribosomal protein L35
MPKLKSNRAAMKRFKVTGSGRIKRYKAGKSHILTKKNRKKKRDLRTPTIVAKSDERRIKRLLLA